MYLRYLLGQIPRVVTTIIIEVQSHNKYKLKLIICLFGRYKAHDFLSGCKIEDVTDWIKI